MLLAQVDRMPIDQGGQNLGGLSVLLAQGVEHGYNGGIRRLLSIVHPEAYR